MNDGRKTPIRFVVWWVDQTAAEIAEKTGFVETLPEYVQEAFHDRYGRPGRKRLWVPENCRPFVEAMESVEQLENWGDEWGGIVLWHRDRRTLAFGPGFVTDMKGFFPAALSNAEGRDYAPRGASDDGPKQPLPGGPNE